MEREGGGGGNEVSKQEKKEGECGLQEKLSSFIYAFQK